MVKLVEGKSLDIHLVNENCKCLKNIIIREDFRLRRMHFIKFARSLDRTPACFLITFSREYPRGDR